MGAGDDRSAGRFLFPALLGLVSHDGSSLSGVLPDRHARDHQQRSVSRIWLSLVADTDIERRSESSRRGVAESGKAGGAVGATAVWTRHPERCRVTGERPGKSLDPSTNAAGLRRDVVSVTGDVARCTALRSQYFVETGLCSAQKPIALVV